MPSKPNVVICLSDMLQAFALGCYGHPAVRTPHIDRLAAEGIRFDLAVTNNPLCTPARSCLMSGQYSRTCTGTVRNTDELWPAAQRLQFPAPTLAERLRNAGYRTGLVGKWHIEPHPLLCGFDSALFPCVIHRHYGQLYVRDQGAPSRVDEFGPDFETAETDRWIERHAGAPFFLFHNISQPHMPVGPGNCPERYLRLYDRNTVPLRPNVSPQGRMAHDREWFVTYRDPDYWYRKWVLKEPPRPTDTVPDNYDLRDLTAEYLSLVTCCDDQLGALIASLHRHGIADDTLVIFASDHGDNLGSHGLFNKGQLIEESIRIPLILWQPGRIPPAVNRRHVASLIDVAPTVLDLCGLPLAGDMQGRSLAPLFGAGPDAALSPNEAYIESPFGPIGVRTPDFVCGMETHSTTHAITDERLVFHDLQRDPYELGNLARDGGEPPEAAALRARLRAWHERTPWMQAPGESTPR